MNRYRLRHLTRYTYSEPVTLSHNLAHLAVRDGGRQQVLSARLDISPEPAQRRRRTDWFGNLVDTFSVQVPHHELTVLSSAELVVDPPTAPDPQATPPWDGDAVQGGGGDPSAWEFRYDSALIPCLDLFAAYAQAQPGVPVLALADGLSRRIHAEFAYDPQATSVATPVAEVLELRRGVCQDFAQVLIACLRTCGIPARYVSGYLETTPPPGRPRLIGADATHAWVQVWCGTEAGWIDLDPTNACIPGDRHIVVAYGRDFDDVSPMRGMVLGGGQAEVTVSVDVERMS